MAADDNSRLGERGRHRLVTASRKATLRSSREGLSRRNPRRLAMKLRSTGPPRLLLPGFVAILLALLAAPVAAEDDEPVPVDRTPPRLGLVEGDVSFWRPGAEEWTPARRNTPLAPGDELYTGDDAHAEIQIGARDFFRAGPETRLALDNDERDYTQLRVTSGRASVDLHGLRAGRTIEIDTPHGAFTVERNGYYSVEVDEDVTRFATRRGGRAVVTPVSGETESIAASEEVVVSQGGVESYAAPDLDAFDRWSYERSERLVEAVSYRHVPDEVYGVDDLDHYGRWRVVPDYGSVWFPSRVAVGWAPYTTGRWIYDPYYGWTWVDAAAWGWAPFHYGRWVHVGGYWGWAPGPIVVRPVYAPALVAFFSTGGVSVGVTVGAPISWVALGWGEPCRPWWGPRRYVGRPHWLGWGGPRHRGHHTTIVNNVNVYQNVRVQNAVVSVDRDAFARGSVSRARRSGVDVERLRPVEGQLPVERDAVRVVGTRDRASRPPPGVRERRVVATRAPEREEQPRGLFGRGADRSTPDTQIVPAPSERSAVQRPRFGEQAGDERATPPPPPRFEDVRGRSDERRERVTPRRERSREEARREQVTPQVTPERAERVEPSQRGPERARRSAPQVERSSESMTRREVPTRGRSGVERSRAPREEASRATVAPRPNAGERPAAVQRAPRELPGRPANRVYGGAGGRSEASERTARPQQVERRRAQGGRRGDDDAPARARDASAPETAPQLQTPSPGRAQGRRDR
jgi:hypothetical protein